MLRVTYIGFDFFSMVLLHLARRADVQLKRVVSEDGPWAEHIRHIAAQAAIPLVLTKPSRADLEAFARDSDLVLCASYEYRLPIPTTSGCIFLNLHPTLLPLGRGPAPIQWTLSGRSRDAGVSLHVMTHEFDAGPIISQTRLVPGGDSFEVYVHRINQAAVDLVSALNANKLKRLVPATQDEAAATYYPVMPEDKRTITPEMTGTQITELIAAMGPMGAVVVIEGTKFVATRAEAVRREGLAVNHAYINWFYGYYPCLDGFCLFHRSNLKELSDPR